MIDSSTCSFHHETHQNISVKAYGGNSYLREIRRLSYVRTRTVAEQHDSMRYHGFDISRRVKTGRHVSLGTIAMASRIISGYRIGW